MIFLNIKNKHIAMTKNYIIKTNSKLAHIIHRCASAILNIRRSTVLAFVYVQVLHS